MLNSEPSSNLPKQTRALLSIRPEFAEAILRGEKRYEFRRRIFSRTVDIVVVYVTAPVSRVVGEFDVRSIISAPLPALWSRTKSQAGIDEAYFLSYFEGKDEGYAIEIGDFRAYEIPYCPAGVLGKRPPQSFLYLDLETVVDAHEAQSGG